jgi:hypothetical protein
MVFPVGSGAPMYLIGRRRVLQHRGGKGVVRRMEKRGKQGGGSTHRLGGGRDSGGSTSGGVGGTKVVGPGHEAKGAEEGARGMRGKENSGRKKGTVATGMAPF